MSSKRFGTKPKKAKEKGEKAATTAPAGGKGSKVAPKVPAGPRTHFQRRTSG